VPVWSKQSNGLKWCGWICTCLASDEVIYYGPKQANTRIAHEPMIAAVFDVRTTRILDRTAADLIAEGFPIAASSRRQDKTNCCARRG
jgi:hypothetical protein